MTCKSLIFPRLHMAALSSTPDNRQSVKLGYARRRLASKLGVMQPPVHIRVLEFRILFWCNPRNSTGLACGRQEKLRMA